MLRSLCIVASAWIASIPLDASSHAGESSIEKLLAGKCLECHSGNDLQGGLDLSHRNGLTRGSESGPVLHPDNWQQSLLWEVIETERMPPKGSLTDSEKESLRDWIQRGAALPETPIDRLQFTSSYRAGYDWWSLQPLHEVPPKLNVDSSWMATPIDTYIENALYEQRLTPNPPAAPRSLLRRVYFDLIGLPPTPEQLDRFEQDPSEIAYQAIVDELLASPAYGERWARHWLDVVRFGESDGFERNYPRSDAWPYRDWVIAAWNDDMPYDQFVRMQIAGDLIDPSPTGLSAAAFMVTGVHNTVVGSSERMKRIAKQDELEEKVGTLCQTFLGLTAQCARCHDHKFDPVSSESYYQVAATLQGIDHGLRPIADPIESSTESSFALLAGRTPKQIYTVLSNANPGPTALLVRGDVFNEGQPVLPGGILSLGKERSDFGLDATSSDGQRRMALAEWVTHVNRPLLARVIVNRLWHYHFGTGLVDTPNDFGFNGGRPTHPELLDYLAAELLGNGMHLKSIQRQIITSSVYRTSSTPNAGALAIDASNRFLWRYPMRRLDGEVVRDAMLQTAGALRSEMGGPGYEDVRFREFNGTTYYDPKEIEEPANFRRTVYRFNPRCERTPLLDVLDCPDPSATAPRRAQTTTPLQALSLLNNPFVFAMSDALAAKLTTDPHANRDNDMLVERMFREVLLRFPTSDERSPAVAFLERHGPSALARALFNSNEFLVQD